MDHVTQYFDSETEKKIKVAAGSEGLSNRRWVAGSRREETVDDWPQSIVKMAGAWPGMPSLDEIRAGEGEDVPRVRVLRDPRLV